ncbi:MAG TPA: type III pantothenate kinase [Candidatus Sulfotelmatobacter sp.]|nr:type III pantothenate kinase [Candidatus Sulfotelmatobacter sp.]
MLLVIDVGNTSAHLGLFRGTKLVRSWRVATGKLGTGYQGPGARTIGRVMVASVVPKANKALRKRFPRARFVNYRDVGIKVKLKKPAEVGIDRLVNALAAAKLYGVPAIIVDFGTATTFDVINKNGEYLGGAIAPGILLSRDILHERTAKLPRIELKAPRRVIGKTTVEALQSGLVLGYVALVEGLVERIKSKVKSQKSKFKVIATGGLARLICKYTKVVDIIDDNLTLKGLLVVGRQLAVNK